VGNVLVERGVSPATRLGLGRATRYELGDTQECWFSVHLCEHSAWLLDNKEKIRKETGWRRSNREMARVFKTVGDWYRGEIV
jgi:hypothetical protein